MYIWIVIFLLLFLYLFVILLNIFKIFIVFLIGYEIIGFIEYIKWKLVRINKIVVWNDVIWISIKG